MKYYLLFRDFCHTNWIYDRIQCFLYCLPSAKPPGASKFKRGVGYITALFHQTDTAEKLKAKTNRF